MLVPPLPRGMMPASIPAVSPCARSGPKDIAMTDIPGNLTTTATFEGDPLTGASFSGDFESFDDYDWIKLSLVAGTTYSFYAHDSTAEPYNHGNSQLQLLNA